MTYHGPWGVTYEMAYVQPRPITSRITIRENILETTYFWFLLCGKTSSHGIHRRHLRSRACCSCDLSPTLASAVNRRKLCSEAERAIILEDVLLVEPMISAPTLARTCLDSGHEVAVSPDGHFGYVPIFTWWSDVQSQLVQRRYNGPRAQMRLGRRQCTRQSSRGWFRRTVNYLV